MRPDPYREHVPAPRKLDDCEGCSEFGGSTLKWALIQCLISAIAAVIGLGLSYLVWREMFKHGWFQ